MAQLSGFFLLKAMLLISRTESGGPRRKPRHTSPNWGILRKRKDGERERGRDRETDRERDRVRQKVRERERGRESVRERERE